MEFFIAFGITFFGLFVLVPMLFGIARLLGVYAIVEERTAHVYVLFGKVKAVLDEPGIYFLWTKLGLAGLVINTLGKQLNLNVLFDDAIKEEKMSRRRSLMRHIKDWLNWKKILRLPSSRKI